MTIKLTPGTQPQPIAALPEPLGTFTLCFEGGVRVPCALIGTEHQLLLHVQAPTLGTRFVDLGELAVALASPDHGKVA